MSQETEETFPLAIDSKLVNFLQIIILYTIKFLALFMTVVIVWSVVDVGVVIIKGMLTPPYLLMDFEDILGIFGGFLIVLIAIEIFLNIILYLRKDMSHIRLVLATALMAISRKVIILDYDKVSGMELIGIASTIVALGIAYWLVKNPRIKNAIPNKE